MKQETLETLALSLIPGLGRARTARLLEFFGRPGDVLRATAASLRKLGVPHDARYYVTCGYALRDAEETAERVSRLGGRVIGRFDADYPARLREIADPPLVLYVLGRCELLHRPSVAIVGARRCSAYGREVTYSLARELAGFGLTVISGMALGIDSQAHWGALAESGDTLAVLGTGLDVLYPRSNRKLFETLREKGCVVTEFPLGTPASPQNFPIRNRIISGLALGTVIAEAAEFSGSLITARLALEQNRLLWAVPGNITNPRSYGPNYLIKQGARPVLQVGDILEELPPELLRSLLAELPKSPEEATALRLPEPERRVYALLSVEEATSFDTLLEKTGYAVPQLCDVLLSLESRNLVRCYPGRRYSRRLACLPSPEPPERNLGETSGEKTGEDLQPPAPPERLER
ncbi:MAG: DNA-processing protein DprA [Acidobacteriota bacterium]